jgi:cell shape-determining protein MreC
VLTVINPERWKEPVMNGIKTTVEQIRTLETERKNLLLEIEELKKMADAKARALESEINMLRDEVKELRLLLGGEDDVSDLNRKKRK